jgi:uncharacterized iron-regulated membrane protein
MNGTFRQSMGWLHIWAGLVVGWVLFFMFITGTAGYFDTEIDRWMQPERPLVQAAMPVEQAAAIGLERLQAAAPQAERWFIGFPHYRSPDLRTFWQLPPGPDGKRGLRGRETLDATTGAPISFRDTGGGQLLYRMHYELHYLPQTVAYWIAGICTMLMFAAIISGIVVHRRIFADFFTFRPSKGQRSWLDVHNILSVLALPFHIMITWSGLVFFAYLYMAPLIWVNYGNDDKAQQTFFDEAFGREDRLARSGTPAPLTPFGPVLQQAEHRLGMTPIQGINIYNPGDANARIVISSNTQTPSRGRIELAFNGVTGDLLRVTDSHSAPVATWQTLLGLHEGLFAGPVLRWLYFLSGLMGTAMIGAGLLLWTTKRRAKIGDTFGFRLVECLNIGTIAGLPVAIAAYFWANRLIPAGFEARAAWEAHVMFMTWALLLLHPVFRPTARAWIEQLWLAAAAFGLLPLLNALTTERHLGVTLPRSDWELAGFDLVMLAFGVAFAVVARYLARRQQTGTAAEARSGFEAARQAGE